MSAIMLPEPPVRRQGNRHICWAAAYESWSLAVGRPAPAASAQGMVERLARIGRGADAGHALVLDNNERLLPDGMGVFTTMAFMRLRLVAPRHLTVSALSRALNEGHVWLWGTPRHASVAHVVVVFGLDGNAMWYMDPLAGILQVPVHRMAERMAIFGLGTPLLRPPVNPFPPLFGHAPANAPALADRYAGLRTGLTGSTR